MARVTKACWRGVLGATAVVLALALSPLEVQASCNHPAASNATVTVDPEQLNVLLQMPTPSPQGKPASEPARQLPCIRCGQGQGLPSPSSPSLSRFDLLAPSLESCRDEFGSWEIEPFCPLYTLQLVRRIEDPPRLDF